MKLFNYLNFFPKIDQGCFIAPGAIVLGRTHLMSNSSIWFNCVLRGDVNQIIIGENSNVQDLSMLHVTEKNDLVIGNQVSVGHSVVMHGCHVEDHCLIGMGAIILDGATISKGSLVAAGTLVSPGKKFPPYSLIKGRPGVVDRALTEKEVELYSNHYKSYLVYKNQYLADPNYQIK